MREEGQIEIKGTISERIRRLVEGVFLFEDVQDKRVAEQVVEALRLRPIAKGNILRAGLAVIHRITPPGLRAKLKQRVFANAPIEIPSTSGYRVLEKIGHGGVSSVFLLQSEKQKESYVLGIRRTGFNDINSAQEYARKQQTEFEYIKRMFSEISDLTVQESQVVFSDHRGRPNVLFLRSFVPGPIKDIFRLDRKELIALLEKNSEFRNQLSKFVLISKTNEKFVVENQLDLLGENNLGVVGEKGYERLILLDPHTRDVNKTGEKSQQIKKRLDYLASIVDPSMPMVEWR